MLATSGVVVDEGGGSLSFETLTTMATTATMTPSRLVIAPTHVAGLSRHRRFSCPVCPVSLTPDQHRAQNAAMAEGRGPVIVVSGLSGVGKSTVSRLVAGAFDRSVHLQADDVMASVVRGWIDPNLPTAAPQHEAIGAALAVSAMSFAEHGYATVVDGHVFPEGVDGLATACAARGVACHYVVLTADVDTCWARARHRGPGRWPFERAPVVSLFASPPTG